jgi:alpha-N-arabinofuranosidase
MKRLTDLVVFIGVLLLMTIPNSAQSTGPAARIKIDTDRVTGEIDNLIYGNFIEHLGRCIEGGVFDEKSALSDANGYRKDVFDATKKLQVSILRWPGGNFASGYHWRTALAT